MFKSHRYSAGVITRYMFTEWSQIAGLDFVQQLVDTVIIKLVNAAFID